ncbi:DUF309 domain-containing protein [Bacillus sp. DTU_2020_1000418_1_SI_GHA_SEK_038]|uniref:DUF309 domain-containing protein n=1 Tax=Bacillus sp. DTU_2020_1000418_1_SI_GHA_SEK_038 TaxID=3077585 RepID=UPI0028E4DD21|nr:DUF309 domain-containing protein [Bacillus sp. DTU_2020_1000418_1_SI_GHA_SEK_038]WNS74093.1 DUF309 domain-containing protein [Bacillus sp. DTU_2020_1000418_1_SI_GHA_SEK_038]
MYPNEYIDYLIHFHGDRDYFECHEILEEYWKKVDPKNKHSIWVGLILLAVSNYHHRRGNIGGAKRTLEKSIQILQKNRGQIEHLGLNKEKFLLELEKRQASLLEGSQYTSYNFPIMDTSLLTSCKDKCIQAGLNWCEDSDLNNEDIIHRHSLRDRRQVIQERLMALNTKAQELDAKK